MSSWIGEGATKMASKPSSDAFELRRGVVPRYLSLSQVLQNLVLSMPAQAAFARAGSAVSGPGPVFSPPSGFGRGDAGDPVRLRRASWDVLLLQLLAFAFVRLHFPVGALAGAGVGIASGVIQEYRGSACARAGVRVRIGHELGRLPSP